MLWSHMWLKTNISIGRVIERWGVIEIQTRTVSNLRSVCGHRRINLWQSQVENEHYYTVSGLIRLVISLECFIEITPDFLCPFMND